MTKLRFEVVFDDEPGVALSDDDLAVLGGGVRAPIAGRATPSWSSCGGAYTHRREWVEWVEAAKKPETPERRIAKVAERLRAVQAERRPN